MDGRPYVAYAPRAKTQPITDLIEDAVEQFRWTHPGQVAGVLLLHPVHLPALGTTITAGGETWMGSYLDVIDPREMRVGPL